MYIKWYKKKRNLQIEGWFLNILHILGQEENNFIVNKGITGYWRGYQIFWYWYWYCTYRAKKIQAPCILITSGFPKVEATNWQLVLNLMYYTYMVRIYFNIVFSYTGYCICPNRILFCPAWILYLSEINMVFVLNLYCIRHNWISFLMLLCIVFVLTD